MDCAYAYRFLSCFDRGLTGLGDLMSVGPCSRLRVVPKNWLRESQVRTSRLNMMRIMARMKKAAWVRVRFSKSFASRRHRPSQPKVRSTIQRFARTLKPLMCRSA